MVEGAVWCMMRRAGFKLLASTPNHCIGALRQQGIAVAYTVRARVRECASAIRDELA